MFKTILEALQRKFPGVDAKMLEPIARKLAKTTTKEEEVATVTEGVTFQQVAESYSDFRVNEAVQTASARAVTDYEAKYNLKNGEKVNKPAPQPAPSPNPTESDGEMPAWAKAMSEQLKQQREQNEAIMKRFTAQDESERQSSLHSSLIAILTEKGVRESFYKPVISGRTFKDEDEVKAYAETVEQSWKDDEQAQANANHTGNRAPAAGSGSGDEDPLLKAAQEKTDSIAAEKNKN